MSWLDVDDLDVDSNNKSKNNSKYLKTGVHKVKIISCKIKIKNNAKILSIVFKNSNNKIYYYDGIVLTKDGRNYYEKNNFKKPLLTLQKLLDIHKLFNMDSTDIIEEDNQIKTIINKKLMIVLKTENNKIKPKLLSVLDINGNNLKGIPSLNYWKNAISNKQKNSNNSDDSTSSTDIINKVAKTVEDKQGEIIAGVIISILSGGLF